MCINQLHRLPQCLDLEISTEKSDFYNDMKLDFGLMAHSSKPNGEPGVMDVLIRENMKHWHFSYSLLQGDSGSGLICKQQSSQNLYSLRAVTTGTVLEEEDDDDDETGSVEHVFIFALLSAHKIWIENVLAGKQVEEPKNFKSPSSPEEGKSRGKYVCSVWRSYPTCFRDVNVWKY